MGLKSRVLQLALTGAFLLPVSSAWAVTFNFASFGNGEALPAGYTASHTPQEGGFGEFWMEYGGLRVTAHAYNVAAGTGIQNPISVYLDGKDSGRYAGMGACVNVAGDEDGGDCIPSDDDNVSKHGNDREMLVLEFSEPVVLDLVAFRNADHYASYEDGDKFAFGVDGGPLGTVSFPTDGMWSPVEVSGTTFVFKYFNEQFYITKMDVTPQPPTVPEPATLGLLGAGLLGLAARARRRRS